jgi:hypothetical protein
VQYHTIAEVLIEAGPLALLPVAGIEYLELAIGKRQKFNYVLVCDIRNNQQRRMRKGIRP